MTPVVLIRFFVATITSLLFVGQALAQAPYPSRPVTLVNPFAPGGTSDIVARAAALGLTQVLGQSVVVDSRAGAGGNVGAEFVARANPDGYTVLVSNNSMLSISPVLYAKLNYDIHKDLLPVIVLAGGPNILVVTPSLPVQSVQDLIALAKSQPGKLNFGSSGNGTTIHLSGEMFKQMAGVDMQHVPYRGAAPASAALIGGEVQLMFDNIPSSLQLVRAGRLRAIAVTGTEREKMLPDLPTVAESGLPGFDVSGWFSLSVPAKTPKEIIAKLNAAAQQVVDSPDFQRRMADLAYRPYGGSPEKMIEMTRSQMERWAPIVKKSGARID